MMEQEKFHVLAYSANKKIGDGGSTIGEFFAVRIDGKAYEDTGFDESWRLFEHCITYSRAKRALSYGARDYSTQRNRRSVFTITERSWCLQFSRN